MSLLVDEAPKSIYIGSTEIAINSDFRTAILFEQMMLDEDFPDRLKGTQTLKLFYNKLDQVLDLNDALEKAIWFYAGGKTTNNTGKHTDLCSRYYDFEYDDEYIFAAFWQQYSIDLEAIEYLHWWKFRALFRALPADCEIVKIMGYRAMRIDGKMSANEKKFYAKMKKQYALPRSQSEVEKIAEIEKMLMK